MREYSLEGRTALVTGGGRGIGKAIALTLAEAGADVAVAARTLKEVEETAAEISGLGKRSLAIRADVSDSKQVDDMVARVTLDLGRIDVLVNNAGMSRPGPVVPLPTPPPAKVDWDYRVGICDETWSRIIDTNLSGVFYCCRAVAPQMLERKAGKIINVASTNAILAYPYVAAYNSSKAAMKMLTKVLAVEWARFNVNVNGIGPGWFVTEMTRTGFEDPEIHQRRLKEIPLGRLTDARDVGLLAVYLASPASDWMTGQVIFLDGGEAAFHA
ncbi:MAG: glucose 1-dehydrogenase [Dehalococcoidia bacterium]